MYNTGSHTQYDIEYHIVWTTKYRYKVLKGNVAERLRELIRQGCEARNITIIRGSIGKEHVHLLISSPPNMAPSQIIQYLKGRSSKLLQGEFKELKRILLIFFILYKEIIKKTKGKLHDTGIKVV